MYNQGDFLNDMEEKLRLFLIGEAKIYLNDIESKLDKEVIEDIVEDIIDMQFYSIEDTVEEAKADLTDAIDDRLDSQEKWDSEEE